MKNVYDEESELFADIKSDIVDTLRREILNEILNIEKFYIKLDVTKSYSPKVYRRRANGGINDARNIVGTIVGDMELEIDNITPFNSGYYTVNPIGKAGLASLINEGDGADGHFYDYAGSFTKPRPFIDDTISEVESTDAVEIALAKGLKRRGYDIK